jgi:hypothetical protein
MAMRIALVLAAVIGGVSLSGSITSGVAPDVAFAQAPAAPRPSPFPGSTPPRQGEQQPPTAAPPAAATAQPLPPIEPPRGGQAPEGTPVYPSAEFIDSYDAGFGQRYYLYGTNAPYSDVVVYYRNTLKNGGREIYKAPAMQQFDLGRFQENSMAYPPSVVVKDYTWNGSAGYLAASGSTEKRFRTVIQIVPPTTVR